MTHCELCKFMILTTSRLILRDFVAEDWPAVLAYQCKPLYLRYYDWTGRTPEQVQEFVQMFLDQQQATPRIKFQLAITLKGSGQLIGNCGVRMAHAEAHQADIGYELDPDHWQHGYATEAARAMVDFGFDVLKVHRIWSWCVADNVGSANVLRKLGLQQEGRLRENEFYKGRYWDTLMFGLLRSERRT